MDGSVPLASQRTALELLRQKVLIANDRGNRVALRGPSGSGKSWIVRQLATEWSEQGGVAVVAGGERALAARSYGVFWLGISTAGPKLSLEQTLVKGASAAGATVPVVGSLVSFLTECLATNRSRVRRDQLLYLRTDEFDILSHLNALSRGRPLLLVADDLQYWDLDSLQLLFLIVTGQLSEVFTFLAKMRLVVTVMDGQGEKIMAPLSDILAGLQESIRLGPIGAGDVATALRIFGYDLGTIEGEQLTTLHALSGGHLELIRQLADCLKANPDCPDLDALLRSAGVSAERFLAAILVRRLQFSGENGLSVLAALESAAIIGKSFAAEELRCLLKSTTLDFDQSVKTATELGLLTISGDRYNFRHEILRNCLIQYSDSRTAQTHQMFAECLSLLRPSDYFTRAEHLAEAGHPAAAARSFFCGLYKRLRDGNPVPTEIYDQAFKMLRATGQEDSAKSILTGHEMILARRFADAIELLSVSENTDHPVFVSERLLLLGLATLQSVTTPERRKALSILQQCAKIEHGERELDMRVKLTLLTAFVHLEMWDNARHLDREISAALAKLQRTDPGAREGLEMQRRKSAMLYGSEVAAERCRRAAAYFGPPVGSDWPPRNPIQFFMAECNLAGNLIVCGKFSEADNIARNALAVWARLPNVKIPRVEKCVNNSVVAGFLAGRLDAHDAVLLLNELRVQNPKGVFSRLIRSNCAVLDAVGGRSSAALEELEKLSIELDEDQIEDPFYRYFIRSNLAGVLHIEGRTKEGLELWHSLDRQVPTIPDSDRYYLIERQKLQAPAFDEVTPGDPVAWDSYLSSRIPEHLGSGWRFFGRGLLLTDTQIWLES